jgi:transcriptional regulator with XRE-family HTH domain
MPINNQTQQQHTKLFRKNLLLFGDLKTMLNEEEMALADRVQLILDELEGNPHGKKAKLSRLAGCTPPVVNHWLGGKQQDMDFKHAQKLAAALGYRIEWLLTGKGPKRPGEGEELLRDGLHLVAAAPAAVEDKGLEDQEDDLYLKVSADELKLINRYRNSTKMGKLLIEAASIQAQKEVPGHH